MKKLYILRHAKADINADFKDDHEKPLAPRGHQDAKLIARVLKEKSLLPSCIISSDSLRTTQTLQNMLPILGDIPVTYHRSLYLATPGEILKEIAKTKDTTESLMVVGHNPGVHQLSALLTGSGSRDAIALLKLKFPTAAVTCFSIPANAWQTLEAGCAQLEHFITPKHLKT